MTLAHQHLEGPGWSLTGSTGTMAAGLAQDSIVFAMGAIADPAQGISQTLKRAPVEIEGIQLKFTAIVSATTAVVAGRRLQLFKSDTNARTLPTGGANLTPRPKRTLDQTADNGLQSGVARISTTAALTVTNFTRDTVPLLTMDLSGAGASGQERVVEFYEKRNGSPLWLDPGEILVISNPVAIDAALTWVMTVNIDYRSRDAM